MGDYTKAKILRETNLLDLNMIIKKKHKFKFSSPKGKNPSCHQQAALQFEPIGEIPWISHPIKEKST